MNALSYLAAPALPDEEHRLNILKSLNLLDSRPDPELDMLVELTAEHFSVPISLISLVDSDRQWFKAKHGLSADETARAPSFCGHAIADAEPFVIKDAHADPRFARNPLVTSAPHVRFYAGVPLDLRFARIGTLCVIDTEPVPEFGPDDISSLKKFAKLAEELIEARYRRLASSHYQARSSL